MSLIQLLKQKWNGTMQVKRQYGWKKTFIVIKRTLLHQPVNDIILMSMGDNRNAHVGTTERILHKRFRSMEPIQAIHVNREQMRIYVVFDEILLPSFMTWEKMVLILSTEFARKNDLELGIVTRNGVFNPMEYGKLLESYDLKKYEKVMFYSDSDRGDYGDIQYKLEVSHEDLFIATSKETAVAVNGTTLRKQFVFLCPPERAGYGETVAKYFGNRYYGEEKIASVLLPGELYTNTKQEQKVLYFAGNENKQESCKGLYFIEQAIEMGILDTDEWKICYSGFEDMPITFRNGYKAESVSFKQVEKYREFLSTVDLTVTFEDGFTPNYVIQEAMASGSVVYTNGQMAEDIPNVVVVADNIDQALMDFGNAIAMTKNRKKDSLQMLPKNWDEALEKILGEMQEIL